MRQNWTADDLISITFYLAQPEEVERPLDSLARPPVFPLALFIGLKLVGKLSLIDQHIKNYDHQTLRIFVPDSYKEFWLDVIQDGMNFECKVGMNVWTSNDVDEFISNYIAVKSVDAQKGMSIEQKMACVYCSTIIPDRSFLPFDPK